MKKTSVISINLKFMRIPLLISAFAATVFASTTLLKAVPPLCAGKNAAEFFLSSQSALYGSAPDFTEVFSLVRAEKILPDNTIVQKTSTPSVHDTSVTEKREASATSTDIKAEISNSTGHNLDAEQYSMLPSFLKEDFSVLIVHTHTTESYTPSKAYDYTPTDTDRTTDKNYNMVRVGKEIEKTLKEAGIKVYHDTAINDYPSYNGSYNKSSKNVQNHIKNDPSIKIVLDVHRDAIEGKNGEKIKHSTLIGSESAAKIMFVVGSDLSGLTHNNWSENMSFAVTLQKHILSMYPNLMRPINFRSQRFNQHLAPGAIIVEVGTNGNTMDEALLGARFFAEGLANFIKSQK